MWLRPPSLSQRSPPLLVTRNPLPQPTVGPKPIFSTPTSSTSPHPQALQTASTAFTVLFCCESLLKLGAQGLRGYFSSGWNVLDFLVSWGSVPSIFITAGPAANVLRTLRIARVLTLMRRVASVRRLMMTVYLSLPTIGNMLLLVLLALFTFAVLGVNLFHGITHAGFDSFLNWNNVGSAMMMLSLVATGDWDG
jgi:hypothetical protein